MKFWNNFSLMYIRLVKNMFLMKAYFVELAESLGVYIPLIVVNCLILGRAESFASKNGPVISIFDGIGMGLGFTVALTIIGAIREFLGSGKLFDIVLFENFTPISIFVMAPGAFFVLAALTAIQNKIKIVGAKKGKDMSKVQSGCNSDCLNCAESGSCARKFIDVDATGVIADENNKKDKEENA